MNRRTLPTLTLKPISCQPWTPPDLTQTTKSLPLDRMTAISPSSLGGSRIQRLPHPQYLRSPLVPQYAHLTMVQLTLPTPALSTRSSATPISQMMTTLSSWSIALPAVFRSVMHTITMLIMSNAWPRYTLPAEMIMLMIAT